MLILLDLLIKNGCWHTVASGRQIKLHFDNWSFQIKNCQGVYGLFFLFLFFPFLYQEPLSALWSMWMPEIEKRLIVLQPSYCAEIQICFNEHRSFAVIVGTQLKLSLLTHIALGCLLLNFNTVFIIPFPFMWVTLNFQCQETSNIL